MKEDKGLNRKNDIIKTALQLFVDKGYDNASTNDIIEALEVSRGCLYHHFKSKEEILETAIEQLYESEKTKVYEILDMPCNAVEKFIILCAEMSPTSETAEKLVLILQQDDNPKLLNMFMKKKLLYETPVMIKLINMGIKEGVMKCDYPEGVAHLFATSVISLYDKELDPQRMVNLFMDLTEVMLGLEQGTLTKVKMCNYGTLKNNIDKK